MKEIKKFLLPTILLGQGKDSFQIAFCIYRHQFHHIQEALNIPYKQRSNFPNDDGYGAITKCYKRNGKNICIVAFDTTGYEPWKVASIMAHEAVHVWQQYCEYIGEHNPSYEFEAYSIQAILEHIMLKYFELSAIKK